MPVKQKGTISSKHFAIALLVLSVAGIVLLFVGGWALFIFLIVYAVLAIGMGITVSIQRHLLLSKCCMYTEAEVGAVEKKESQVVLTLMFQGIQTAVTCSEKRHPYPGQMVGICYNPADNYTCMLAVYKDHRPGYTNTTKQRFLLGLSIETVCALFFVIVGVLSFIVLGSRKASYTEVTPATVTGYETVSGHVFTRYKPALTVYYDGKVVRAQSVYGFVDKPYTEGEVVQVHYQPLLPAQVMIDDNNTPVIYATACCVIGALFTVVVVWQLLKVHYRLDEIEDVQDGVNYL